MKPKNETTRRKFLGGTAAAITGAAAATGEAAAHNKWLPIYTTTNLNARSGPGTNYSVKHTVEQYTGGQIRGKKQNADGYTWWKIRWNGDNNNGRFTGWSAGNHSWTDHASIAYPSRGYCSSDWDDDRSGRCHCAVDIANSKYTNVYAGRGGYHTTHWGSGCGNYSVIDHSDGYETLYCHLNSFVAGNGVNVSKKDHIGEMGTTGNSTGDHVHFQVRRYGDAVYTPGETGDQMWEKTGLAKNYNGLSTFPNAP